jgi:hypothetical protein
MIMERLWWLFRPPLCPVSIKHVIMMIMVVEEACRIFSMRNLGFLYERNLGQKDDE